MNYADLILVMTFIGTIGGVFLAVGGIQYLQGLERTLRKKWKEQLTDAKFLELRRLTDDFNHFKRNR